MLKEIVQHLFNGFQSGITLYDRPPDQLQCKTDTSVSFSRELEETHRRTRRAICAEQGMHFQRSEFEGASHQFDQAPQRREFEVVPSNLSKLHALAHASQEYDNNLNVRLTWWEKDTSSQIYSAPT